MNNYDRQPGSRKGALGLLTVGIWIFHQQMSMQDFKQNQQQRFTEKWSRASIETDKNKEMKLAWANAVMKWGLHCQTSSTVDIMRPQKKRATTEHLD